MAKEAFRLVKGKTVTERARTLFFEKGEPVSLKKFRGSKLLLRLLSRIGIDSASQTISELQSAQIALRVKLDTTSVKLSWRAVTVMQLLSELFVLLNNLT